MPVPSFSNAFSGNAFTEAPNYRPDPYVPLDQRPINPNKPTAELLTQQDPTLEQAIAEFGRMHQNGDIRQFVPQNQSQFRMPAQTYDDDDLVKYLKSLRPSPTWSR